MLIKKLLSTPPPFSVKSDSQDGGVTLGTMSGGKVAGKDFYNGGTHYHYEGKGSTLSDSPKSDRSNVGINPPCFAAPLQGRIKEKGLVGAALDDFSKNFKRQTYSQRKVIVVTGPSGIGKTHFVADVCAPYIIPQKGKDPDYHVVAWVEGDKEIEKLRGLSFSNNKPWIIVLDNMSNCDRNLFEYFSPGGCIIVTSSKTGAVFPGILDALYIELGILSSLEGSALLKNLTRDRLFESEDLKQLSLTLDNFPLHLHMAGSYLSKRPLTIASYCKLIDELPKTLKKMGRLQKESVTSRPPNLEKLRKTVEEIMSYVRDNSPLAYSLLERISHCSQNCFQLGFFQKLSLSHMPDNSTRPEEEEKAIKTLEGVVSFSGNTFWIHGSIKEILSTLVYKREFTNPIFGYVNTLFGSFDGTQYLCEVLDVMRVFDPSSPPKILLEEAYRQNLLLPADIQSMATAFDNVCVKKACPDKDSIVRAISRLKNDYVIPPPFRDCPIFVGEQLFNDTLLYKKESPDPNKLYELMRYCLGGLLILHAEVSSEKNTSLESSMLLSSLLYRLGTFVDLWYPNSVGHVEVSDVEHLFNRGDAYFDEVKSHILTRFRKLLKEAVKQDISFIFKKEKEFFSLSFLISHRIAGKKRENVEKIDAIFNSLPRHSYFENLHLFFQENPSLEKNPLFALSNMAPFFSKTSFYETFLQIHSFSFFIGKMFTFAHSPLCLKATRDFSIRYLLPYIDSFLLRYMDYSFLENGHTSFNFSAHNQMLSLDIAVNNTLPVSTMCALWPFKTALAQLRNELVSQFMETYEAAHQSSIVYKLLSQFVQIKIPSLSHHLNLSLDSTSLFDNFSFSWENLLFFSVVSENATMDATLSKLCPLLFFLYLIAPILIVPFFSIYMPFQFSQEKDVLESEINLLHSQFMLELGVRPSYSHWIDPILWSIQDSPRYFIRQLFKEGLFFLLPLFAFHKPSDRKVLYLTSFYLFSLFKAPLVTIMGRKSYDALSFFLWYLYLCVIYVSPDSI